MAASAHLAAVSFRVVTSSEQLTTKREKRAPADCVGLRYGIWLTTASSRQSRGVSWKRRCYSESMTKPTARLIAKYILWVVSAFYAYGAIVHVMNMAGLNNFDWTRAPLKWQVLDIAYFLLDVVVVIGLVLRWTARYVAFFAAALSQILLYTVLRSWILEVPVEFARTPEEIGYLGGLVTFHLLTVAAVLLAIWLQRIADLKTSGRT